MCFCVAGAVKKWKSKATEHDISRAVGDHLKPLVEPGVVFTTPSVAWEGGIDTDFHTKRDQESVDWSVIGLIWFGICLNQALFL